MSVFSDIQFGEFGDHRDEYRGAHQPHVRQEMYQPPGSKKRFQITRSGSMVKAQLIGKPDSVLPGGRPAKQAAGVLHTWSGGTGAPEGHKEILSIAVAKGHRGLDVSRAMLKMAQEANPDLTHSHALTPEGARFAHRNPLPGDTELTKKIQARNLVADAATALLGGPRRTGDYRNG